MNVKVQSECSIEPPFEGSAAGCCQAMSRARSNGAGDFDSRLRLRTKFGA